MEGQYVRRQITPRDDERAGTRPALFLATGLAVVAGGVALAVLAAGSAVVSALGGVGEGTRALLLGAGLWVAFWVWLSLGLIGGLWVAYRAWRSLAQTRARRVVAAAHARTEEAAAVEEAEELIERARRHRA